MKALIARAAAWLYRKMEGAELHLTLRRLRQAGHRIDPGATFGRRCEVRIAARAHLDIAPGVRVLQDSWLIAHDGDTLRLEENVFISQHCTISGTVRIGRDTLIGGFVTVIDGNHRIADTGRPISAQGGEQKPIDIGEDVWIGSNAVILQGVRIGDHAVVAANATVTKDVPAYAVVAGTPARVLRDRREGA